MKEKIRVNKKVRDLLEEKILNLFRRRYPQLFLFGKLVLPKKEFNFLSSLLRFSPKEVLELSSVFKNIRIKNHSTKFVKVELLWHTNKNGSFSYRKGLYGIVVQSKGEERWES